MNIRKGVKFIGPLLLACLLFIGPVQGAEKEVIIKLATLAHIRYNNDLISM